MGKSFLFKMYKLFAGCAPGLEICATVPLEHFIEKLQTEFYERAQVSRNLTSKFWVKQVMAGKGSNMGKIAIFKLIIKFCDNFRSNCMLLFS